MLVMLLRGLLAPGGHVAWAAIAGGALLLAKRDRMLSVKHYFDYRFIIFFWLAIAMHAIWDMPIYISDIIPVVQIVMTLFAWVILFVLMSAGLKEVSRKSLEAKIPFFSEPINTKKADILLYVCLFSALLFFNCNCLGCSVPGNFIAQVFRYKS